MQRFSLWKGDTANGQDCLRPGQRRPARDRHGASVWEGESKSRGQTGFSNNLLDQIPASLYLHPILSALQPLTHRGAQQDEVAKCSWHAGGAVGPGARASLVA